MTAPRRKSQRLGSIADGCDSWSSTCRGERIDLDDTRRRAGAVARTKEIPKNSSSRKDLSRTKIGAPT
uniref:Uncharacterized protein n=1 Tax=Aegilops tauschii subsp. strangulata TaxID=200361 RepID=A0A453RVH9_AEGTS